MGPSSHGRILSQPAGYVQLLQREILQAAIPALCVTRGGQCAGAGTHICCSSWPFLPSFLPYNTRTKSCSFCSRAKKRCVFPILISSIPDVPIYQNATCQSLQAKIKQGDDVKTGWGELIKEATSSGYMHHVIPVISYLCLALKPAGATSGDFPQMK